MKTTGFKPKIVTVLATLSFLSISVPTIAADFFPLDVWEEIEAWEQTTMAALDPYISVHNETIPWALMMPKWSMRHSHLMCGKN